MTSLVDMKVNVASAPAIAAHLRRCDDDFIPRLSDRVEIDEYSRKITRRATRFEAWAIGSLVGLVAAYFDAVAHTAYITTVSVDPQYRKRGLASRLLVQCVASAQERGCTHVLLEVDRDNGPAIDLYKEVGFTVADVSERTINMRREVQLMGSQP
jgi:ribosomal protein S18 acetylase RimI-like enzyme